VFDSLIAAGNSFQIVGVEKLKERLPKLVVQKGIDRRFRLAEQRHRITNAVPFSRCEGSATAFS